MASIDEILEKLTKIQRESYKDVIDIALGQFTKKTVEIDILERFFTIRYNREDSLYKAVTEKYKNTEIVDSYNAYKTALPIISGRDDELDDMNGVLHQNVYGEASKQRERRRIIAEFNRRGSALSINITSKFSTYKQKLEELKGKLT